MLRYLIFCLLVPGIAFANADEDRFVAANLLSVFYHELGHAMIDVLGLPVFGQEEDAADVASILMIDTFYEEDVAQDLAYDAAFGFWAEAELGADAIYWDVHGPDEQRFFNTVCLFYGANPQARDGFAADMGLPEERADTCPEEYDLAMDSWGAVMDEIAGPGDSLIFDADGKQSMTAELVGAEVAALNGDFIFPEPIAVRVAPCGEANAYYDPATVEIVMCTEFEAHLRALFALIE
ncbi:DUF4344 domain-containing metallopeptidase [uncultured Tateyamaria sp.]|uniref:DUF4344 domain-containing metallopeptidase n=1 Tax=Tateyamaria sp. 1078 TaxID=3417464 RepID=UPI00260C5E22|nr:DUF4344 domain-containing metallopeptidase [uncultured Tateyamaria sp.]